MLRITRRDGRKAMSTFDTLKAGDVFVDEVGDLCMRIDVLSDDRSRSNGIVLKQKVGNNVPPFLYEFSPGDLVRRVDAELIVTEEVAK